MNDKVGDQDREVRTFLEMLGDQQEGVRTEDLERFVEEELQKDAEVMDTHAVVEALTCIQDIDPERMQADKESIWQSIERDIAKQEAAKRPRGRIVRKTSFAAACLAVLLVTCFGGADAFNWQFLVRVFEPLASTFGFVVNVPPEEFDAFNNSFDSEYVEGLETQIIGNVTYTRIEDVPQTIEGYPVLFPWLPDGFEFVNATYTSDTQIKSICVTYSNGEDEIFTDCTVFLDTDLISIYEFEKNEENGESFLIGGKEVSIGVNTVSVSAAWEDRLAYYNIWGATTIDNVERMIEAYY